MAKRSAAMKRVDTKLTHDEPTSHSRPVGVIQPTHERAVRALRALDDHRIADAKNHIIALPDSPLVDRTWKLLVSGLVAIEQVKLCEAELHLLQASALAFIGGLGSNGVVEVDMLRVAARAVHHLGWVYRRQDRPYDAYCTHLAAYHLREQHGSYEELWETATELGLDADIARRYEEGQRWHDVAIEAAGKASEEPARKQAIAWTNLSTSCTNSVKHDEAVSAARTARDLWRQHDMGAVTAAQADLKLSSALLKRGESLCERSEELAKPVLEEASGWLTSTREALLAFGSVCAADAESCRQQQDFVRRLLASLER